MEEIINTKITTDTSVDDVDVINDLVEKEKVVVKKKVQ